MPLALFGDRQSKLKYGHSRKEKKKDKQKNWQVGIFKEDIS